MDRAFIRGLLVEQSFAYGFTIAFWGSGLLLIEEYGLLHTVAILSYAVGAITGFALLAVASFGGVFTTVEPDGNTQYVLSAGIHYLACLVPIVGTHLVLAAPLGRGVSLLLAGANVSVLYNLSAMLEEGLSEFIWHVEQRYG